MIKNDYLFVRIAAFLQGFAVVAAVCVGCSKEQTDRDAMNGSGSREEIVLGLAGDSLLAEVMTKTTNVTSVPSTLYWGATTGSGTSEAVKWASASASVSSGKINTGNYQTLSPTSYNYYVSNIAMTVGANTTVTATNTTDVIVGRCAASTSTTPSVTLGHIFSRTGTLTFTATGYTITNVSWKIVGKSTINGTKGVYNLRTGAWTSATTKLTSETTITSSSNLYLIPGTYTVKITFTASKDGNTKTFTKTGDVVFAQGKVCNITATPNLIDFSWDDDWDDEGEVPLT